MLLVSYGSYMKINKGYIRMHLLLGFLDQTLHLQSFDFHFHSATELFDNPFDFHFHSATKLFDNPLASHIAPLGLSVFL